MNADQTSDKSKKIFIKSLWVLIAVGMYAFFGLSFVVGKETLKVVGPFFLTGVRMIFASVVILGLQWIIDRTKFYWPKGMLFEILLLSIFNIFLTNCLEFWGLQYMNCYKTCYIYSLTPFIAAIVSFLVLKERLGSKKIIGLVIGFIGFVPLLVFKQVGGEKEFYISAAEWALLGAAFSSVIGWVAMRKICYEKKYPFFMANGISMLIGGIFSFVPSLLFEGFSPLPVLNWKAFLQGMAVIALINNIIGYNLYAFLVRKFTVTLMSFIGFIAPLVTALFGWIFLRESVTMLFFISYAVVLIGFFVFSREELVYNVK